jgi:hypothetical protein
MDLNGSNHIDKTHYGSFKPNLLTCKISTPSSNYSMPHLSIHPISFATSFHIITKL